MIVDCHTHVWANVKQLGDGAAECMRSRGGEMSALPSEHAAAARCVDKTLVLAFRSVRLGAAVPNDYVAEHVARYKDKFVGVAAVDPTERSAPSDARDLLDRQEFRGLTVSPVAQGFHPADSRAMAIYELAQDRGVPVFFQQGPCMPAQAAMEHGRPILLDQVAREFPGLTIVVCDMGHPWCDECVVLMRKHQRVFGDISALLRRPWQAYGSLLLAWQIEAIDRVLFGSGFPYLTAAQAIEGIYRLQEMIQGSNMPIVPREALRSIVERDALAALGMAR